MNATVNKIEQLAEVPKEKQILFGEVSDLKQYAEEHSMIEALAMAFKYGFSAGQNYEKEN